MSQRKYALELLKCGNVLNDKPISTPLDPIQNLNLTDGEPFPDPSLYRTLVGKLIYLTITRPDISFAAQLLSKFSQAPRTPHMKALNIMTGHLVQSLSESVTWFMPSSLGPVTSHGNQNPIPIYYDNSSTIALASNPIQHARTKHIEIDCHFVRDKISFKQVLPIFISTKLQGMGKKDNYKWKSAYKGAGAVHARGAARREAAARERRYVGLDCLGVEVMEWGGGVSEGIR
ncbi:cysteine-rich receptor-like protein kinase 8 [Tanacetum coccineum]